MPALVELPFLAETPASPHNLVGVDMAATNKWQVDSLTDPDNEATTTRVGTFGGTTYDKQDIANPGRFTHVALKLQCTAAGAAKISNITIRHDGVEPAT
jgi:hypothetical protein